MAISNRALSKELLDRGLIPDGCRLLEVVIAVDSAVIVRYEKFLSADEMSRFAEAMKATAEQETTPRPSVDVTHLGPGSRVYVDAVATDGGKVTVGAKRP